MNNSSVFRTKNQELERLLGQIDDIKTAVKEIGTTVSRIERHVRRAFDVPSQPKNNGPRKRPVEKPTLGDGTPTISGNQARDLFDDLSILFSDGQRAVAHEKLQDMSLPDLRLLAHELGVAFRSRPSRKNLCDGIIGRLNERAMLSKNTNLTPPQASSNPRA